MLAALVYAVSWRRLSRHWATTSTAPRQQNPGPLVSRTEQAGRSSCGQFRESTSVRTALAAADR
jgi:hypothetical protein